MKLSAVFILALTLQLSAAAFSQKLALTERNAPLEKVILAIEKQTGYYFFFDESWLRESDKVTIDVKNETLKNVLDLCFKNSALTYSIVDSTIVLKPKDRSSSEEGSPNTPVPVFIEVRGLVTDENSKALQGVSVAIKGANIGAMTDVNGRFVLQVPDNGGVLVISYIGYKTIETKVTKPADLRFSMEREESESEEVVVIGYGTTKKRDLTGSVSSLKIENEPIGTTSSIGYQLAGKMAGLTVSTTSAQPGGEMIFRIRGATSPSLNSTPLIIVDGFPVNSPTDFSPDIGTGSTRYKTGRQDNALSSINPHDIASIDVLKDASATAIYGARAANGVIIITTKRGSSGKAKVTYSSNFSTQQIARKYDMLNASDFMKVWNLYQKENWLYDNGAFPYGTKDPSEITVPLVPMYTQEQINNPEVDTDWFSEILRKGRQQQHNISINGGNENTLYLISLNYFDQKGIFKNNNYRRYNARLNLNQKLGEHLKTGISFMISRNLYDNVPLGSGTGEASTLQDAVTAFNPLIPVRDADGNYTLNPAATYQANPVSLLEIIDNTNKERLLGTIFLEAEPVRDLKLRMNLGVDRNFQKRGVYLPKTTLYGQKFNGDATIEQMDNSDYLAEYTANYSKKISSHNFGFLAGYSYQTFNRQGIVSRNYDFISDAFRYYNLGAGQAPRPVAGSSGGKSAIASFFSRVNYSFLGKYLLTATFRGDGASNFSKNHKWGYFPSVAGAWRISEENFMESIRPVVSSLKLRVSYGKTGNSNIGYAAYSQFSPFDSYSFNNVLYNGVALTQLGNPNLKWETTSEFNVGLDFSLLNNRINVTTDYYYRVASDLLDWRALLSYNEVQSIADNIGKTEGKGFELNINTVNIEGADLTWTSDFTFFTNKNNWKERSPYWKPTAYQGYHDPIRSFYGYISDGIVQPGKTVSGMPGAVPGQTKILDIDGYAKDNNGVILVDDKGKPLKTGEPDGSINDADKVYLGTSDPKFTLGFNNKVQYKNFDLSVYVYGNFKYLHWERYNYQSTLLDMTIWMTQGKNLPSSVGESFSSENLGGTRIGFFQTKNPLRDDLSSYNFKEISFVRVRNITLGYAPPIKKTSVIKGLRIYIDANNPFLITNYDGLDPEMDNVRFAYPNVRSNTIGLEVNF